MSRPLFVRPLTEAEGRKLARLVRSHRDARIVRRAQIVQLSHQGYTCHEIAKLWNVHPLTALRAIKAFNTEGLESLIPKKSPGRPPKASERYVALLKKLVMTSPRDLGYPFSSWTLERLREHLARQTGVFLHGCYLSQLMARHGIVYRRPKHVMAHLRNPKDYNEKKALLQFLKKAQSTLPPASTSSTLMSVKFTSTRPLQRSGR